MSSGAGASRRRSLRPRRSTLTGRSPVFDLDGTLLDSDAALVAPFVALGVPVTTSRSATPLADECAPARHHASTTTSSATTSSAAQPFAGVDDLVARLDRWAVCSNKHQRSGRAELERLGWQPEVALFADGFGGPKQLGPVLDALGVDGRDVVFVG